MTFSIERTLCPATSLPCESRASCLIELESWQERLEDSRQIVASRKKNFMARVLGLQNSADPLVAMTEGWVEEYERMLNFDCHNPSNCQVEGAIEAKSLELRMRT